MPDIDFSAVAKRFSSRLREQQWKNDPVLWATDHNIYLWSKQQEVVASVINNPKTLVVTGNSMGKSFMAATVVNWWIDTHDPMRSTVVTTATNWKQVVNVLWKEIPRIKDLAGIPGRITSDARWIYPNRKDPVAFGMKPADKDESGFQGVHDTEGVLVIIDEAGGVSKELFTAADAVTTTAGARTLAIANPNDPSCYMATIYKREIKLPPEERTWNIIQFGAYDSPNFTGEDVPEEVKRGVVQKSWVEARRREWGEDDPRFVSRVLGKFPDVSDDGLFNMGRVAVSMNTHEDWEYDDGAPVRLGVDVARYGSDQSVIAAYQDGYVWIYGKYSGKNGPELARIIGEAVTETGAKEVRIDGVGVGVSVIDHLPNHVSPDVDVYDIKGNGASPDNTKWYNWRAASYDQVSRRISDGSISLPNDPDLYDEIASIKYEYRGSALLIESKEAMRKRGIHSPDILDAVVYCAQDLTDLQDETETERLVDVDELLDDMMFVDEWGNEPWSIFPA